MINMCFKRKVKPKHDLHRKDDRPLVTKHELKMFMFFLAFIIALAIAIKLAIDCTSWYNIHNLAG